MKNTILAFILFSLSSASSAADCTQEAFKLLEEESEIYVVDRHTMMHGFLDCSLSTFGMEVVVHEAVHTEDLGVPAGLKLEELENWFIENPNAEANLFSLDKKHIGAISLLNAPTPKVLVLKFLSENYPDVMGDSEHPIHDWLAAYILDETTYASNSFPRGLTELNAYIHGLRFEARVKKDLPNSDASKFLMGQRHGLYHFLFLLKAYVHELKQAAPNSWVSLNQKLNQEIIKSLITDAKTSLVSSQHCAPIIDIDEKALFDLLADPKFFNELRSLLQESALDLDTVLCK